MNENAYLIIWSDDEGNLSECVVSGFTIAEADEKFGKRYGCDVVAIQLVGEFYRCVAEEEE